MPKSYREGFSKPAREDEDVEGHGSHLREGFSKPAREDEDVEGHGMGMRSPASHGE